jgi:hypothetical protein
MASTNIAYRRFETMTLNVNPTTGIRYGVIALGSLDDDLANEDLWYGPGAKNLSEEAAAEELRKELRQRYEDARELAEGSYENAVEMRGIEDNEENRRDYISEHLEEQLKTPNVDSAEDYVEWAYERECDFQIDEPEIEGEYDGVKYRIRWLGGAPLLWVIEGPIGYANRLCSPCVPNAADLDGGFNLADCEPEQLEDVAARWNRERQCSEKIYGCYVVPEDWLRQENDDGSR